MLWLLGSECGLCISHLLSKVPYDDMPSEKVTLPKRQKPGDYVEPDFPFKFIPESF